MISKHTSRIRQALPSQAKAPRAEQADATEPEDLRDPWAAPPPPAPEAVPANTPGRDDPVRSVDGNSLLGRLVHMAEAVGALEAEGGPGNVVLDTDRSQRKAMEEVWRAYNEVVAVLSAITRSARLVEMGVCAASQLAAIDLLNDELPIVWAKWDSAHRKVISRQARREEP